MRHSLAVFSLLLSSALLAQNVPEPAPGLRIPDGARPWAQEEFQGKKQLVPVHSSAVQPNQHKGSNIAGGLVAGPFYKSKFSTEIEGDKAKTVLHSATPVFYLLLQEHADSGQSMIAGWTIVHAAPSNGRRLLSTVKFTQLTGKAKRNDTQVDVETEQLPGGWLKIAPKTALPEGEYAILPVMKQENAFSMLAYDFRVDPKAENDDDAVTQ